MLGEGQRPALGGVGFGTVGVQPGQVVVHHLAQLGVLAGGRGLGQHPVDLGEVDALLGRRGQVRRAATGAITATCSAVICPSANAAATAGRCSTARPVRRS